jgi:serine/threonine-protein kinase
MTREPAPPRKTAPEAPADLEIICLKALEKVPERRYATAREMADDLGRFLSGEPIRARRASLFYRLRRFVSRRRAVVAVSMAGLLVAAGIGLFALFNAEDAGVRRRRVTDHLDLAARHAGAINDLLRTKPESDPEVERQAKLAFEEIDKAMAIEPDNADAHFQRGRIHSLRFEKDDARKCYELAIRKGPVARAHLERAHRGARTSPSCERREAGRPRSKN